MSNKNSTMYVFLVLIASMLASCGKHEESSSGQSIVRVNGEEITVMQLNNELQRAKVPAEQQEQVSKKITAALIDRQLLIQAAKKDELDRNPSVMQAIETAKAQILAQAYLERKVGTPPKVSDQDISAYYNEHRNAFENRRIYQLEELAFKVDSQYEKEIEAFSHSVKTLSDMIEWLNSHHIQYKQGSSSLASEAVPPQLLEKLLKMTVGDVLFVNMGVNKLVLNVKEIKPAAVSQDDAKSVITQLLSKQKMKQLTDDVVKSLQKDAKIEYLNKKFAPDQSASATPAENKQPKTIENSTENTPSPKEDMSKHIEKGLSGL